MCGRFTTAGVDRLRTAFPNFRFPEGVAPRYNIAPTDPVVAAVNDGSAEACWLRWGLVPAWSSGPGGRPAINARIETIAEKQSWRRPLSERRCAIFADGFYEWH